MAAPLCNPLVLRVDAGPSIGLGHLMRTVAIGQEWRDRGGEVTIITASPVPQIEKRLNSEAFSMRVIAGPPGSGQDAIDTAALARSLGAEWIVVDGYRFLGDYQKVLKDCGYKVLFIDDYGHAGVYPADIVLNQNISARDQMYFHRDPGTRLLLGPRYAMIRQEFVRFRNLAHHVPESAMRLLVTLGGADPDHVTLTVIQALKALGRHAPHATFVIGEMNPCGEEIARALASLPGHTIVRGGESLPDLMSRSDAAISGGGSTTGELLFMGVPFLSIILAENQERVVRELEAQGFTRNLGKGHDLLPEKLAGILAEFLGSWETRAQFSEKGRHLVDGFGTARIGMHLSGERLWLREAEKEDCMQIWEWANDLAVRQASFHPARIPLVDHKTWFSRKLSDPGCFLFIAMDRDDQPVGQIRFDLANDEAEVDYSIDERFRGKGLGFHLLVGGLNALRRRIQIRAVKGYVKPENPPSIRTFEKAGFVPREMEEKNGFRAIKFTLDL